MVVNHLFLGLTHEEQVAINKHLQKEGYPIRISKIYEFMVEQSKSEKTLFTNCVAFSDGKHLMIQRVVGWEGF